MTGILTLGSFVQGAELEPEWTSFKLSDQGQMELSFSAHSGQTYVIEASQDLAVWQVVSDPIVVSDTATNWIAPEDDASHQFYRLVQFDLDGISKTYNALAISCNTSVTELLGRCPPCERA